MKKILFLIHDLSVGGAEKVLVNLVNNLDTKKYDVTVLSLFDVGVNKQFLLPHIHYKYCFKKMFRGNSHLMKLLTPKQLHSWFIKDKYDIEVAYLEGPCSRIISGCPNHDTQLYSWIHIQQYNDKRASRSFRNRNEAIDCYGKFTQIVCVSETVKQDFSSIYPMLENKMIVKYNTNETDEIIEKSKEEINILDSNQFNMVGVGKLLKSKGFDRLAVIINRLVHEGYNPHLYVLGVGEEKENLEKYILDNNLSHHMTLLGYDTNPYKYVSKMDLFVCASFAEGFSTAATEALIVGTPVCTVEVSGMKEMLGYNNEYGLVVDNDDEALYAGIKSLLDNNDLYSYYKKQASIRGKDFNKMITVKAVEEMFSKL